MQPVATIFHLDLPQALEDEYRGFLNKTIVSDFADYAWLCFRLFGDRIKHWITINEPFSYSVFGYAYGTFPPNRCSGDQSALHGNYAFFVSRYVNSVTSDCKEGNSGTEPYLVSHHLLLAHAAAVKVYRGENFQKSQKGQIGITLNVDWAVPYDDQSEKDQDAAKRALAFMYGWFMDPLYNGTYPNVMVTHVKERLPKFSKSESEMVKGSYDFIGINYYTASYSIDRPCLYGRTGNYLTDSCVNATFNNVGRLGLPSIVRLRGQRAFGMRKSSYRPQLPNLMQPRVQTA
ncbi:unnamed protein product [Ilex paraguariensis]|uniref:Uncharacterized protein n=1 Tax=Ilex paraguariensis TaxID=185542 RepID=A0ABC8R5Y5_9AQUA